MNLFKGSLCIAVAALPLAALGFAQNNGVNVFKTDNYDQYGDHVFQTADPQFMKEAAQDAMAKIHLAYLALQNSQNEQVKSFALQILTDYSKAQSGLFRIANNQAVVLPNTLDPKNLNTFEALSQLQGTAFDKAYMQAMLNGDQTATERFKQEAKNGDGWANHTLPTLESNLKEAQKVAQAVGVHSTVSGEQHTSTSSKPNTGSQETRKQAVTTNRRNCIPLSPVSGQGVSLGCSLCYGLFSPIIPAQCYFQSMTPWFIATKPFSPVDGERWRKYIEWSGLKHLTEVVSLDSMLCPPLLEDIREDYWPHIVNEEYMLGYFLDLEFLKREIVGSKT